MKSNSQIGQDIFVNKLIPDPGFFIELGGYLPIEINNTYLLELKGWSGISFDIMDYRKEWEIRKTPLLIENAVTCDFHSIFEKYSIPNNVDYLSVDLEREGERFLSLINCFKSKRKYKIITIEHDSHLGYTESERNPQRNFLESEGYFLLFGDVKNDQGAAYEDWWINPDFFDIDRFKSIRSEGEIWRNILEKI